MIYQLTELGIDFTKISDYELFIKVISQMVSSKKNILRVLENNYYINEEYAKIYD